jgi:hypothetical protein
LRKLFMKDFSALFSRCIACDLQKHVEIDSKHPKLYKGVL